MEREILFKREILFRGKTLSGKWVEGIYSPYNWDIDLVRENKPQIIILSENKDDIDGLWCDIIPETAGQYTGLIDKNGTKIFEGDIVRYGDTIHEVVFEQRNGTAYFGLVYSESETLPFGHYQDLRQIEVIGNIYDNGYPF